ncbi:phosphohydrolase [Lewinellaceae bacterium SD302]|nr:phosphohydrolase [Lewinellaceae bacterium SD302]
MQAQAAMDYILGRLKKDLPRNLYYHSIEHTLDVLERVESLAVAEGVGTAEIILLKVAACYHDAGFLINNRNHEKLGCRIVREHLPEYRFSSEQIKTICGMIMSTKIPQSPRNHLEEIICDSDLDYLGREDFASIGQRLFRELKAYNVLQTEEEWDRLQINFLTAHSYWTTTNRKQRASLKATHLATLKSKWG